MIQTLWVYPQTKQHGDEYEHYSVYPKNKAKAQLGIMRLS